jgi:hypothetical protein
MTLTSIAKKFHMLKWPSYKYTTLNLQNLIFTPHHLYCKDLWHQQMS